MAQNWTNYLGKINRAAGIQPGMPVPVANVLKAFEQAGMPEADQARILASFLATHDTTEPAAAAPVPAAPATTLTMAEIMQLIQNPAQHADLVEKWKKLTPEQQAELTAQIDALKPAAVKAPDVDTQKMIQPVLNVMQAVQTIVNSSTPKRTKMLDVIQELNKVLPTPALGMKDDKGVTYAQSLINMLNSHADKFGTTATPGDKFVKLLAASIQQNKPIELPQTALESRIIQLSKALSHR